MEPATVCCGFPAAVSDSFRLQSTCWSHYANHVPLTPGWIGGWSNSHSSDATMGCYLSICATMDPMFAMPRGKGSSPHASMDHSKDWVMLGSVGSPKGLSALSALSALYALSPSQRREHQAWHTAHSLFSSIPPLPPCYAIAPHNPSSLATQQLVLNSRLRNNDLAPTPFAFFTHPIYTTPEQLLPGTDHTGHR